MLDHSPRKESVAMGGGLMAQNPMYPVFPQIPKSERNAVDWSIWQNPGAKRQGSTSSLGLDYPRQNFGMVVGLSSCYPQTNNVAGRLKEQSSGSLNNGYDRNYLLATIQDVFQSMLTGCNVDQSRAMVAAPAVTGTEDQRLAAFGLTGEIGGIYANGGCGFEGVQQQYGCVPEEGRSLCPADYRLNTYDHRRATQTSRYFK